MSGQWAAARVPDDLADAAARVMEQFKWTPYPNAAAPNSAHSPESITSTIATLESLAETLPAVLTVANGWAPADIKFRNRDAMHSAVDMLRKYRDMRRNEGEQLLRAHEEQESADRRELTQAIFGNGVKTGIEQEQARVKEARKGRKRGARKS